MIPVCEIAAPALSDMRTVFGLHEAADDLDEPAGFIDRVIGGDTSGIDEAIAKLEEDPGAEDPAGGAVDN